MKTFSSRIISRYTPISIALAQKPVQYIQQLSLRSCHYLMFKLRSIRKQTGIGWLGLTKNYETVSKNKQKVGLNYMRIQSRDVTAAERGSDHFDSELLRVWRTHFDFLHHQCLPSSPCHRSFLSKSLNKQQCNVINLDKQIIIIIIIKSEKENKKVTFASDDIGLLDRR